MEPAKLHAKDTDVLPSIINTSSPSVRQSVTPIGIILPAVVVSVVFIGCSFLMRYIKKHYQGTQLANSVTMRVTQQANGRHNQQLTNHRTEALELTNVPLPEPPPPYEECVVQGVGLAVEMGVMGSSGTDDPALPDYEEAIREGLIQSPYTGLTQGPHVPGCSLQVMQDTMIRMGDV